jgi:uncharacterized membrane protein YgcG
MPCSLSALRSSHAPTPQLSAASLELQQWLLVEAKIPEARMAALLKILEDNWIADVATLVKSVSVLEKHLPAAAYVAIKSAAVAASISATSPERNHGRAAVASIADTASEVAAPDPPGGVSTPMKFGNESRLETSIRTNVAQPPRSPQRLQRGGASTFEDPLAERERALRRAEFKAETQRHRAQLQRASRMTLAPDGWAARVWEHGVLALAVLFVLVVTPLELGVLLHSGESVAYEGGTQRPFSPFWWANRLVELILWADVLFRFHVAFREPDASGGRLVYARGRIARRYVCSYLALDLLAAAPIELSIWAMRNLVLRGELRSLDAFHVGTYEALYRLTRLAKLLRPGHVYGWLPSARAQARQPVLTTALLLGLGALLLAHWLACTWAFVGLRTAEPLLAHVAPPPSPPLPPPARPPLSSYNASEAAELAAEAVATAMTSARARAGAGAGPPWIAPPLLASSSWIGSAGLLDPPAHDGDPPTLPRPSRLYAAALRAAAALVFGLGGGGPAPVTWEEQYVAAALRLGATACWLHALMYGCAVLLAAAAPGALRYRETFEDVGTLCREGQLPSSLQRRLRAYFRHVPALEGAERRVELLERTPPHLRLEAAFAMAPGLLGAVPFLAPTFLVPSVLGAARRGVAALPLEKVFIGSVVLALLPVIHCPREYLAADALSIVEKGRAALKGRVLRAGGAFGLDVLLARADLRDAAPAIALTHCQLLRLSRDALLTLAAPHPAASHALRVVAIHRALRRGFVLAARHRRHSLLRRDPSASDALTTALAGDRAAAGEAAAPTTAPPPSSPSPARAVLSSTYDLLPPWYCAEAPPWARPEAPPPPPHAGAVVSAPLGGGSEALGEARTRALVTALEARVLAKLGALTTAPAPWVKPRGADDSAPSWAPAGGSLARRSSPDRSEDADDPRLAILRAGASRRRQSRMLAEERLGGGGGGGGGGGSGGSGSIGSIGGGGISCEPARRGSPGTARHGSPGTAPRRCSSHRVHANQSPHHVHHTPARAASARHLVNARDSARHLVNARDSARGASKENNLVAPPIHSRQAFPQATAALLERIERLELAAAKPMASSWAAAAGHAPPPTTTPSTPPSHGPSGPSRLSPMRPSRLSPRLSPPLSAEARYARSVAMAQAGEQQPPGSGALKC